MSPSLSETPSGNRVRIAFFGLRNAGKSTLVNAFCGQDVAIVSDVPGIGGLYIATGHEGDGIALAPVTGKTVADMVTGRETEFDMTPFAFARFAEKKAAEGGRA